MADRVLVTGASGFVGSELVSVLARRDPAGVIAASRHAAAQPANVAQVRVGDMGRDADWQHALAAVTHVVHCAARVHVMQETAKDAVQQYRRVNTRGTLDLARQAAAAGVRRFVFLSSIKVSGDATDGRTPFREEDAPNPCDAYGTSKLEAEEGLKQLARESGMDVVVIRPVLVYGPGVRGNFHSMMTWISRGVPLPFGLVRNRRSILGLANLVDLILTCLDHPGAANETFLASDGVDLSTADLLRRTGVAVGRPARLVPVPPPFLRVGAQLVGAGARIRRLLGSLQVDIHKAQRLLGWAPPVSIDDELARTAEHFLEPARP